MESLKPNMVLGWTFSIKPESQKQHVEQNESYHELRHVPLLAVLMYVFDVHW